MTIKAGGNTCYVLNTKNPEVKHLLNWLQDRKFGFFYHNRHNPAYGKGELLFNYALTYYGDEEQFAFGRWLLWWIAKLGMDNALFVSIPDADDSIDQSIMRIIMCNVVDVFNE